MRFSFGDAMCDPSQLAAALSGVTELSLGPRNAYEPDTLAVERKIEIAERLADAWLGARG